MKVNEDFFDFDTDILKELVGKGYSGQNLISKFIEIKHSLPKALDLIYEEAKNNQPMTKEEAMRAV